MNMKGDLMKKIIFIIITVVIGVLVYLKSDEIIIPTDAIRVRIIANSNSIEDLYQKKKLKDSIKDELYSLVKDASSFDEANNNIKNGLNIIKKLINEKNIEAEIDYGLNYFPKKTYKGVVYPEGEYQSLVITLGSGLGDNWWCVLYPPLCMINENSNTDDVEYKLLVKELLN